MTGPHSFSEYCRGGDLFDYIIKSPDGHLSEADAKLAVGALCEALAEVQCVSPAVLPAIRCSKSCSAHSDAFTETSSLRTSSWCVVPLSVLVFEAE